MAAQVFQNKHTQSQQGLYDIAENRQVKPKVKPLVKSITIPNDKTNNKKHFTIRHSVKNKILQRLPTPLPVDKKARRQLTPFPRVSDHNNNCNDGNESDVFFNFENVRSSQSYDDLLFTTERLTMDKGNKLRQPTITRHSTDQKIVHRILTPKPLITETNFHPATPFPFTPITNKNANEDFSFQFDSLPLSWSSDDVSVFKDIMTLNNYSD